ncbi:MAG: multicopper oxidase domain-containing protein [Actinomycetota bacterium]|nr:multicopper oxidase domain-containing protein [Actinomycetota bacterium]
MTEKQRAMLVWPVAGFFVVIAFGVGLISMAAFDSRPASAASNAATSGAQQVEVTLGDIFIKPTTLKASAGSIQFHIRNTGQVEHNFDLGALGKTPMIPPGDEATLEVASVSPGSYPFQCDVPGHADAGMRGTLTVSGSSTAASAQTGDSGMGGMPGSATGGMGNMSAKKMAALDAKTTGSFPAATKGVGGRVLKPRVLADGTKVYSLTASVIKWEVSPGEVKEVWAYNGMVPGPAIEPNLGDHVRVILHNHLPEPTTIHFHGMTVPNAMDGVPGITQDAVLPGHSFTYEFTVRNTGTNMYHSHFDAVKQVPMGLLGPFVIHDRRDPHADVDQIVVLNDGPLGFTLNGKSFPATAPIVAKQGQWVRIRYMNEGQLIHPMHLHGMPSKVIAIDGHLLAHPYLADTVMVAPGQRVDVLVHATEKGIWALHCHILSHAEGPNGMFGMVTALVVQ